MCEDRRKAMEISKYPIPLLILSAIILGLYKGNDVYGDFLDGAESGAKTLLQIFPNIIAVMASISMLKASGFIEIVSKLLAPALKLVGMPAPVLTLAFFRPLSGSASLSVVEDIFRNFGADSESGLISSVMMGSTETTFYTVALYFGSCGIKNIRHTLFAALAADIVGIIASVVVTRLYFNM